MVVVICFLFFTEILILSKFSDISANAQRINTSQLQCKNCVGLLSWIWDFLNIYFVEQIRFFKQSRLMRWPNVLKLKLQHKQKEESSEYLQLKPVCLFYVSDHVFVWP